MKGDVIYLGWNCNCSKQDLKLQTKASFLKKAACASNMASSLHVGLPSVSFSHICFVDLFGIQKGYESLEGIDVATEHEFNSSVFEKPPKTHSVHLVPCETA